VPEIRGEGKPLQNFHSFFKLRRPRRYAAQMGYPGTGVPMTAALAHPVTAHPHVEIPLGATAVAAAIVVLIVALAVPTGGVSKADPGTATYSWHGSLSLPQVVARTVAVVGLALAILAGRVGVDDELENIAPALSLGAGLPLLFLAALLVGPIWRWLDPWDATARLLLRDDRSEPPGHVWPAVAVALAALWFISVYPQPLDPRAVGTALAVYSVVTLGGCVALGRIRWLASGEPLGLLLTWVALTPRRRLVSWRPPRGAEALLGVSVGGLLFGAFRRTELWSGVAVLPTALLYSTAAFLLAGTTTAGLFMLAVHKTSSRDSRVGVAYGIVPVVAGIVLAVGLALNRLFTSVQLLPGLVGDPLGRGWDVLGPSTQWLDPAPLGTVGLLVLQLCVVVVVHVVGAVVVGRRLERGTARTAAALTLTAVVATSVAVVSLH